MTMLEVVTQSTHPFTLADFRDHVRVSGNAYDAQLQRALDAAVVFVESAAGVFLRTTTVRETFRGVPGPYRLSAGPVVSITGVADVETGDTIDAAAWRLDKSGAWPKLRAVQLGAFSGERDYQVTYTAGYAAVPGPLTVAVHATAALHFENREAATPVQLYAVPLAVHSILGQYGPRGM